MTNNFPPLPDSDYCLAPLTDEQIAEAVREADLDWHHGWTLDETKPNRFVAFARAIERAHGVGHEGDAA